LQRSTGRLVGIMVIIVVAGMFISRSYYGNLNRSVDPRIKEARQLYEQYDRIAQTGDYYRVTALLDTIADLYGGILHYEESFELGVLHNNRAAILLTVALYGDSIPGSFNPYLNWSVDSMVNRAEYHIRGAMAIYDNWSSRFEEKNDEEIRQMIREDFMTGLEHTEPDLAEKYLTTRVREIRNSLLENRRRLSVCYTNLGLVHRLRGEHTEAAAHYEKAIDLWERNLEAENNLNRLLGRPLKKRNIIQKLFPPGKEITDTK